ncbi:MAG: metalloregulator ArsR/SmtB family transcription factor [Anaerolineaceae bacterium]|nr:metalloregulator ArsR/SmtB family transcription factor [Anaerolineaceae bacterium]
MEKYPLSSEDQRLAAMLKALGNPVRFRIMRIIANNKMCITGDVVEFTDLAQSTVSQHLKILREAGLLKAEVEGSATSLCLNDEGIRWMKAKIDDWLPECCPTIDLRRFVVNHKQGFSGK